MRDHRPIRSIPVSTGSPPPATPSARSHRAIIGAAILLFAVISAYLGLVIITRVDSIFFPGHQLTLPGAVGDVLPGVDANGDSGIKNRINILVMGLDRRPSEGQEPTRTDTLFIVTVDPKTKSTGILGIPRDGRITPRAVTLTQDFLRKIGALKTTIPYDQLVTGDFLPGRATER